MLIITDFEITADFPCRQLLKRLEGSKLVKDNDFLKFGKAKQGIFIRAIVPVVFLMCLTQTRLKRGYFVTS